MRIHIKVLIISLFLINANSLLAQGTAKDIFLKATGLLSTENVEIAMAIDITDDKGRVKAKELTVLLGKFGEEEKTKVVLKKPERAKGTTIIITELPGEIGVIEIYTPSNGKTRKLKATDTNIKLMGGEFSMTSFANYNPDELNYELLSDTSINNKPCYRIKVSGTTTKDNSSAVLVIRKESYLIIHSTRFNEKNKTLSKTELFDYKPINGDKSKMYPMRIVTKSFENHQDILIRILDVSAKKDLTKSAFTI